MICQEQRVVVRNVGFKDGAEIWCAGSGVTHKGNFAETDNDFGKKGLVEALASSGETGGGGRMGVADGLDIGAHLIEEEVHAGFGRYFAIAIEEVAFHVHDYEITGRHQTLVKASGGGEDTIGVKTDGEVTFRSDNVAAFVEPATNEANIMAVLLFRARGKIRY
jgi:hypothetical protein